MVEVIPAIIPETKEEIEESVTRVMLFVSRVQVDVLDGRYMSSISWPYREEGEHDRRLLARGEFTLPFSEKIFYEIDMMLRRPEDHIEEWLLSGAQALVLHYESTDQIEGLIARVRDAGLSVGVALKPSTPNEVLGPLATHVDFIQCMGNDKIGFHGVELDPRVYDKLSDLRARYPSSILGVDIGVTFETAPKLVKAGATRLVSGSAVFKSSDIEEAINRLRES